MLPPSDTQSEMTFVPSGLLAMLWLAPTTTSTARPEYAILSYMLARNVISICRHEQRAPQPQQQNTSNTAPGPHREPCPYTAVGFAAFKPERVTSIAAAPRSFRARDAIFELRRLSGLTWEELATLLSVTRRSLRQPSRSQICNTRWREIPNTSAISLSLYLPLSRISTIFRSRSLRSSCLR